VAGVIREEFVAAARVAAALLGHPAVADGWAEQSALAEFGVGGLAGHLGYQVICVPEILATPPATEEVVDVVTHFQRVPWIGADVHDEFNVRVRDGGEKLAAAGPAALVRRVEQALPRLDALADAPDRPARMPSWGPWAVSLDDLVLTRLIEVVVHVDDLAASVGVPTPELPGIDTVVATLAKVAARRHGPVAVLRGLARSERAPATISAF
jgi:hypothetical protein